MSKLCDYIKCKKHIDLIQFKCYCSKLFCILHRYPEIHNCNYDYKEHLKLRLIIKNPQIIKSKIDNKL